MVVETRSPLLVTPVKVPAANDADSRVPTTIRLAVVEEGLPRKKRRSLPMRATRKVNAPWEVEDLNSVPEMDKVPLATDAAGQREIL